VLILVSGATATMRRMQGHPQLGRLLIPATHQTDVDGWPVWAADNGAFSGFDANLFLGMLERVRGKPGCKFVTVPDVVADACATMAMFEQWAPRLWEYGFPLAYVAQDGLERISVPWCEFDALFIGGSTAWKMSRQAFKIAERAKERGKWLHVGRVNTRRRMRHWYGVADSIDGTGFSMFPDTHIGKGVRWLKGLKEQPRLL
jgi:hypothetical protein